MQKIILLIISFALASCASITPKELVRVNADLRGACHQLYALPRTDLSPDGHGYVGWVGHNRVFAIGDANGRQVCGFAHGGIASTSHDQLTEMALNSCNRRMPNGVGCQVYAIDADVVYSPTATMPTAPSVGYERTANTPPTTNIGIPEAKAKCLDLGFKAGTEGFGKCVLKFSN